MTARWYHWPVFWPLWALAAMAAVLVGFLLPGEAAFLVALAFTTPHRSLVYGGVGEGAGIALVFLTLIGGMILEDE